MSISSMSFELWIFAPKPRVLLPSLFLTILSRPIKAPPTIKRILLVFIAMNS